MIRSGILCEFLSQQSCDYAVDIFSFNLIFSPFFSLHVFFPLILLLKFCAFFLPCDTWQWNSKELQAPVQRSGMLQAAPILLLTLEIMPSLI